MRSPAGAPQDEKAPAPKLPDTNLLGLTYEPLPGWVPFESKETVQKWVDENDTRSMTLRAWQPWGGLTELVNEEVGGQKYRVPPFETWFDLAQVFGPPLAAQQPRASRGVSSRRSKPAGPRVVSL